MDHQAQNREITRQTEALRHRAAVADREMERLLHGQAARSEAILRAALAGDARAVAHADNRQLISHPDVGRYEYQGLILVCPNFHHNPETCPFCE